MTGPRLFHHRQFKGLAHHLGDIVAVDDRLGPLGDGPEHPDHIHVLMAFFMLPAAVRLAGEDHQRRPVHIGIRHAGHQIGGARPQGAHTDAGSAGQSAVDIGDKGSPLLMPADDETDGGSLQGHHEVGVLLAGYSEDVLHPFIFQTSHKKFRSVHGLMDP